MSGGDKTYHWFLNDVKGREPQAFKKMYTLHWEKLYIYAFKVLANKKQSEDIVQEIFLTFWKNRHNADIENVSAYLFQALRFQLFKHFKNKKFTKEDVDKFEEVYINNTIEDMLHFKDLETIIHQHIEALPPKCKTVFRLSRFENLSNKEIAEKLGVSIQTVKNQISKALKYLRDNLKDSYLFWLFMLFNSWFN